MYQDHWGLRESPFRGGCDPRFFHLSPTHEEALARLYFLVEQGRRLGLLMGPAGSGKSLLLEVFARQLRRQGRPVAKLSLIGLQPAEMLSLLAGEFALALPPTGPLPALWRAVSDRLAEHRLQQVETVVLLDDADQAAAAVMAQVVRLAVADSTPEARLTIVLAGQQRRLGRIGRRLLDLAELRIDVAPWNEDDTAAFVENSLTAAGCEQPVFDPPAFERLHALAHGIPRRVSQLADLALLAAAGRELQQIDAELIEAVSTELGVAHR
jgi:type II secretory pathway predicted ATPase ExeA